MPTCTGGSLASEQGVQKQGCEKEALIHVGAGWEGISPAALFTSHRPFWVVLTVTEVRHEVVKPDNSTAAKHSVVARNLQLGQHVPHDPRHWAQVGDCHNAPVHWACLLLREPLGDAGIAESVLTMRRLEGEQVRAQEVRGC